jgi:hypothetical protein
MTSGVRPGPEGALRRSGVVEHQHLMFLPPTSTTRIRRPPPICPAPDPPALLAGCLAAGRPGLNLSARGLRTGPSTCPLASSRIARAAGTFGRPGMVMMSPQTATTNSAPALRRSSRTGTTWPDGAPRRVGSVEKLYWVLATQTGKRP